MVTGKMEVKRQFLKEDRSVLKACLYFEVNDPEEKNTLIIHKRKEITASHNDEWEVRQGHGTEGNPRKPIGRQKGGRFWTEVGGGRW